ncbi:MAG: hypothetical protein WKG07_27495 [Hymenobacter sp.]
MELFFRGESAAAEPLLERPDYCWNIHDDLVKALPSIGVAGLFLTGVATRCSSAKLRSVPTGQRY